MDNPIRIDKKKYVTNEHLLKLLKEYKETKVISEELGESFFLIAHNLSYSRQFINYSESWKNEMISDALYNFCRYVGTFNVEKGVNPFAYFTQIAINAFIMRIKKEKFHNIKEEKIREELYDNFLHEYKLTTGQYIDKTEDAVFLKGDNEDVE